MEVGVHIAQRFGFRQQSLMVLHQFFGANAVFAGQGVALAQALFYLGQSLRVELKTVDVMAQGIAGLLHLNLGVIEQFFHLGEGGVFVAHML